MIEVVDEKEQELSLVEVPKDKKTKSIKIGKMIVKIALIIGLVVSIFFLYMHFVGTSGLNVNEIKISSKQLPQEFHGLKIVHFTDLQYLSTTGDKELKRLVNKINEIRPDVVVFTGDLISKNKKLEKKDIDNLVKYLNKIEARIGLYAVKGDNDYNNNYDSVISKTKFKIINNSYELIYYKGNIPIMLTGIGSKLKNDYDIGNTFSYNEADNLYTITLVHEPDVVDEFISKYKPNLVMAGHSNNGLIRLPFVGGLIKFDGSKKYVNSKYKIDNSLLYISNGIGTNRYEYRLFNHPSINFYRLVREK